MNIFLISYCFIVVAWLALAVLAWYRPRAITNVQRPLWWLFAASLIIFIAWRLQNLWLSGGGMIVALIGVAQCAKLMDQWLKRQVQATGLLILVLWLGTVSLLLAHLLVIWLNIRP